MHHKTNQLFTIGQTADAFSVGDIIQHATSKTIYESDNNLFSLLTMNHHPIHTNADYAKGQRHGQELVVGTLVLSLIVGMTVPEISGKALANLGYDKVRHLGPTFTGDTLYCRSEVLEITPSSNGNTAVLKVKTFGFNQNGADIISFERDVLLPVKAREGSDA
ncbi:MaoC family dehydratase [Sulfitobacter sp.]|uniref:MaoC family dehydratase n=1 Tax=Sulfitobacter sp. TaxID=1903071 RepID=UPI0026328A3B|nr:MaoC family dehydratase [Sulfitobacter sp.]